MTQLMKVAGYFSVCYVLIFLRSANYLEQITIPLRKLIHICTLSSSVQLRSCVRYWVFLRLPHECRETGKPYSPRIHSAIRELEVTTV